MVDGQIDIILPFFYVLLIMDLNLKSVFVRVSMR